MWVRCRIQEIIPSGLRCADCDVHFTSSAMTVTRATPGGRAQILSEVQDSAVPLKKSALLKTSNTCRDLRRGWIVNDKVTENSSVFGFTRGTPVSRVGHLLYL